jgi:hypothetical protein
MTRGRRVVRGLVAPGGPLLMAATGSGKVFDVGVD